MTFSRCLSGLAALSLLASVSLSGAWAQSPRVEKLIGQMTLEEKIGQLNLLSGHHAVTGPYATQDVEQALLKGEVGGLFNVYGAEYTRNLQRLAVTKTRLGIPLLLGYDVLHGYRTIFPVPLGQAASFDLAAIEQADRIAAREASAAGVNWIYAPMLDITRDPRWGRIVEGPGESTWWGSRIAAARVRGMQGLSLSSPDSVLACAKHFAGNGATEGGRDYSGTELSERAFREVHLPPFKAAVDAGVKCMMTAFNTVDGVPGVSNEKLIEGTLRKEWGFKGIVVSDFGAIGELVNHGVADDPAEAALLALRAGVDIDMQGKNFITDLPKLVKSGAIPEKAIDTAVRRILTAKEELGLFDNPYGRSDPAREAVVMALPEHRAAAQAMAEKSLVLLKNDNVLPLSNKLQRIAVIGPLAQAKADTLGPWAGHGDPDEAVTVHDGIKRLVPLAELLHATGGTVTRSSSEDIAAAVRTAAKAEVVILVLGEKSTMSGEAASRSNLNLPGDQMALARAVLALGKPTAVVLMNGRPLTIEDLHNEAPAIVEAWYPGTMGGLAVARLLFGEIEPLGRLPVTFPRNVGQIPIYHDQLPTGRPAGEKPQPYTSTWLDVPATPLYPFGYGLTWTKFEASAPRVDKPVVRPGDVMLVSVDVTNTGKVQGTAQIMLFLRQKSTRISRPVRDFKGFARASIAPGKTVTLTIPVRDTDLFFARSDGTFGPPEAGFIEVQTGFDAGATKSLKVDWRPKG